MPRSYACRTRLVKASWPSSRCTRPPNVPVPKAIRVTLTLLLPRVTQSVASLFWGCAPSRVRAAAPKVAARKSRRVYRDIVLLLGKHSITSAARREWVCPAMAAPPLTVGVKWRLSAERGGPGDAGIGAVARHHDRYLAGALIDRPSRQFLGDIRKERAE